MPLVGKGTGKEGMDACRVSCSALSGTLFMQYWNMVPSAEVHFKKNHGTIFIKRELFHALQNESFLGCGVSLINIKTCQALFTCDRG